MEDRAIHTIYKSIYNIPKNVDMMGPSSTFRLLVKHSTAISDFSELINSPIDPRILYFHEDLD